jgi:hypothetical protein
LTEGSCKWYSLIADEIIANTKAHALSGNLLGIWNRLLTTFFPVRLTTEREREREREREIR